DVVTDLLAGRTDEIDALDGLVDALPVEDATLQLLDADPEKLLVLPFDLATAGFVLGELFLGFVDRLLLIVERAVCFRFRPAALVALARACHASLKPPQRVRRVCAPLLLLSPTNTG